MKIKYLIFLTIFGLASLTTTLYSQSFNKEFIENFDPARKNNLLNTGAKVSLAPQIGIAYFNDASGMTVGLLVDVRIQNISILPQANYWKVNESTNFEMAAIMRFRFESKAVTPYVDGGFGVNFYESNQKDGNDGITKLGLDIGGGIEIPGVFKNADIFIDGKYKIIINDSPNIKGYTLTAGIKFDL